MAKPVATFVGSRVNVSVSKVNVIRQIAPTNAVNPIQK